jgi:hypothetical protein
MQVSLLLVRSKKICKSASVYANAWIGAWIGMCALSGKQASRGNDHTCLKMKRGA